MANCPYLIVIFLSWTICLVYNNYFQIFITNNFSLVWKIFLKNAATFLVHFFVLSKSMTRITTIYICASKIISFKTKSNVWTKILPDWEMSHVSKRAMLDFPQHFPFLYYIDRLYIDIFLLFWLLDYTFLSYIITFLYMRKSYLI